MQWDPDLNAEDIACPSRMALSRWRVLPPVTPTDLKQRPPPSGVAGVLGVANDIEVRLPAIDQRPDPDIARDAVAALKSHLPISHDGIKVVVKDGWLTLEGEAEWRYQKSTAENAVRKVKGVKGVTNVVTVKPKAGTCRYPKEDPGSVQTKRRGGCQPNHR